MLYLRRQVKRREKQRGNLREMYPKTTSRTEQGGNIHLLEMESYVVCHGTVLVAGGSLCEERWGLPCAGHSQPRIQRTAGLLCHTPPVSGKTCSERAKKLHVQLGLREKCVRNSPANTEVREEQGEEMLQQRFPRSLWRRAGEQYLFPCSLRRGPLRNSHPHYSL